MCGNAGIAGVSPKSGAAAHQVTIGRRVDGKVWYRLSRPTVAFAKSAVLGEPCPGCALRAVCQTLHLVVPQQALPCILAGVSGRQFHVTCVILPRNECSGV